MASWWAILTAPRTDPAFGVKEARNAAGAAALEVQDLEIRIHGDAGAFTVVSGMSLAVAPGETVCLVGESGCGKTMTALALLGLLPKGARMTGGAIRIEGRDFNALSPREIEDLRGNRITMIFQDALTALNPVMTIGDQIAESLRRHRGGAGAFERAVEALRLARMPDPERRARQYPHELSGGMRQRAMIALALACEPRIIVADEPTTALDVTIQAQILGLISDLQRRLGAAHLLITHDLGVVSEVADRVVVMYAGRPVEQASVLDLFDQPLHPYTVALMGAIPRSLPGRSQERLTDIGGAVPALWDLPPGCAFAPRCPRAVARCRSQRPPYEEKRDGHFAACWEVAVG
jgi:peptide/nickel transport system ATP-binding protein